MMHTTLKATTGSLIAYRNSIAYCRSIRKAGGSRALTMASAGASDAAGAAAAAAAGDGSGSVARALKDVGARIEAARLAAGAAKTVRFGLRAEMGMLSAGWRA
jgi:hypothetical protein